MLYLLWNCVPWIEWIQAIQANQITCLKFVMLFHLLGKVYLSVAQCVYHTWQVVMGSYERNTIKDLIFSCVFHLFILYFKKKSYVSKAKRTLNISSVCIF